MTIELQTFSGWRQITLIKAIGSAGLLLGSTLCFSQLATAEAQTNPLEDDMEKVTGIGGFFFVSENPEALRNWYKDHLGIDLAPQFSGEMPWMQEGGLTVFDPFEKENDMIPTGKTWMINFRVGNLSKMVEQLKAAGIEVSAIDEYPHGKFATLTDPEGNGIQLWEVAQF